MIVLSRPTEFHFCDISGGKNCINRTNECFFLTITGKIATQFKSAISGIFIAHYEIGVAFGALLQHFSGPQVRRSLLRIALHPWNNKNRIDLDFIFLPEGDDDDAENY
jgi:hypothetical protein